MTEKAERIAKRIARAGVCSRRDAERMIVAGRVCVDGVPISSPALNVTRAMRVSVDGAPLPEAGKTRLWRYHKPRGLVTSHRDPQGRPTVFDVLPGEIGRVISIGRLDLTSEGLLLLTNDGELARRLELPSTGWLRQYRVRVYGRIEDKTLARLERGVEIDGTHFRPAHAKLERQVGSNAWLTISIREGKNREVRRLMEHLGYTVNRLIRTGYGPFQLGKLPRGHVEEVPAKVIAEQVPRD